MKMCPVFFSSTETFRVETYPPPNCTLFVNMLVNGKKRETWDLLSLKGRDGGVWRMSDFCVGVYVMWC